jgi:secretion/DNA translocation related TadE-like protein
MGGAWPADQRGSGSVLAIAVIGAVVGTALAATTALGALVVRQQAMSAADAAALAGADAVSGLVAGDVCAVAESAASANDGSLISCTVDGSDVTVEVGVTWSGAVISARSRAGPPPDAGPDDQTKTASR